MFQNSAKTPTHTHSPKKRCLQPVLKTNFLTYRNWISKQNIYVMPVRLERLWTYPFVPEISVYEMFQTMSLWKNITTKWFLTHGFACFNPTRKERQKRFVDVVYPGKMGKWSALEIGNTTITLWSRPRLPPMWSFHRSESSTVFLQRQTKRPRGSPWDRRAWDTQN